MGIRDWFKKRGDDNVRGPSDASSSALETILAMIKQSAPDEEEWLTFEAKETAGGREATIELAWNKDAASGPGFIPMLNFCTEKVDLSPVLSTLGFERLRTGAEPASPGDTTAWILPGASAKELARVMDAVFVTVLGMGASYSVHGKRQG